MSRSNSARRNSAFDLTKPNFVRPQNRIDANRWLEKVTFGAATALTNIEGSTKTSIVSIGNDEAVDLMNSSYAAYLDNAFNQEPDEPLSNLFGNTGYYGPNPSISTIDVTANGYQIWFARNAVYGNVRARVKATYALSQLIAVRQIGSDDIARRAYSLFASILFNATKSTNTNSFRKLLKDVTYTISMGNWLTYNGNVKANEATNVRPDENYAREIMQLFSVGLDCLNMDGTPILDSKGIVLDTYPASYVSEAAKFFTGLNQLNRVDVAIESVMHNFGFMVQNGTAHETAEKELIPYPDGSRAFVPAQTQFRFSVEEFSNPAGYSVTVVNANQFTVNSNVPYEVNRLTTLNGGTTLGYSLTPGGEIRVAQSSSRAANSTLVTVNHTEHGLVTGQIIYSKSNVEASIDAFIDRLVNHPTCAPFVAKSLIKLLVTSNPSPQYIRRVAEKFVNNGNGVMGDLSAVFKAIYLDRECIIPFGKNPNNHGKYTTIYDRILKLANALRDDTVHCFYGETGGGTQALRYPRWGNPPNGLPARTHFNEPRIPYEYPSVAPTRIQYISVSAFNTPSVFNFYRPGYVPPKSVFGDLGLTAPEFQVTTAESQTIWTNIVLAATQYSNLSGTIPSTSSSDALDSRGNQIRCNGLDFNPTDFTVTAVGTANDGKAFAEVSGSLETNIPGMGNFIQLDGYNVRTGQYFQSANGTAIQAFAQAFNTSGARPSTTGSITTRFTFQNASHPLVSDLQVGDVIKVSELFVTGISGFPGRQANGRQPYITLFHKAALAIPNTETVTDAELDNGIAYWENRLMTRPISPELRALMKSAANQPITLPTELFPSMTDAAARDHYRYMVYGYAQIRMRRMLAVLLVSPEYLTMY